MISQIFDSRSQSSPGKSQNSRKEFIWDQLIVYTAYIFVVFTLLAAGEQFFSYSEARCLVSLNFNRDQAAYVNAYCTRHVRKMEQLSLLFLLEILFVGGPHIIWSKFASSALEQFFSMAPTIERYRDRETGRFDVDSIEIVQRLQTHFGSRQRLKSSYCIKLVVHLLAALVFLAISASYYTLDDFSVNFDCSMPEDLVNPWLTESLTSLQCSHLNVTLLNDKMACMKDRVEFPCTYTQALLLEPLWICSFLVIIIAASASIYGLYWYFTPHWQQLDYKGKALFLYSFCIHQGQPYKPKRKWIQQHARIGSDLDLLVMMLYGYDKGHGKTFYEIQLDNRLEELWSKDFETYVAFTNDLGNAQPKGSRDEFSGVPNEIDFNNFLTAFAVLAKKRLSPDKELLESSFALGLHLFCGQKGASLYLAKYCQEVNKMIAVDFDCFFRPLEKREHRRKAAAAKRKEDQDRASANRVRERPKSVNALDTAPDDPYQDPECLFRDDLRNIQLYCVPDNMMGKSPSKTNELLVPLHYKPGVRNYRKENEAKYDLVFVSRLEPPRRTTAVKNLLRNLQDNLSNNCLLIICTAVSNTSVASDEEQGRQDETDDMDELHKMVTSDLKFPRVHTQIVKGDDDHLTFHCDSSSMVVRMRLYSKDKNQRETGTKL